MTEADQASSGSPSGGAGFWQPAAEDALLYLDAPWQGVAALQGAGRAETTLLSAILHELSDPLTALVTTVRLLGREGDSPASRSHAMSILANKAAVDRLFADIGPHFADRPGGYTRIFKLGVRPGDGATVCQIERIDL